jgi:hypothetical protein
MEPDQIQLQLKPEKMNIKVLMPKFHKQLRLGNNIKGSKL